LFSHDIPKVSSEELEVIEKMATEIREKISSEGGFWGWKGGRVVLVPTDKKIAEWEPIAFRDL
jgi:2',3'-cyclic-nucleotide 3'-phosphodiesterase